MGYLHFKYHFSHDLDKEIDIILRLLVNHFMLVGGTQDRINDATEKKGIGSMKLSVNCSGVTIDCIHTGFQNPIKLN